MIRSDLLSLSQYIIEGHRLTTREAARQIREAMGLEASRCTRVDFTGIASKDISREFISELFRLEYPDHDGVWLSPVNYSVEVSPLLTGCFSKLKKMRISSMQEGFIKAGLHFENSPEHSS